MAGILAVRRHDQYQPDPRSVDANRSRAGPDPLAAWTGPAAAVMNVRFANVDDVPVLTALGRRAHSETRFAAYDYDATRVADNLAGIIELGQNSKGTHCVFLAEDSRGQVAGILIGLVDRQLFSALPVASVLVYYVFPDKRMSGAGFRLITAFRKWAENRSAFEICIGINSAEYIKRTDRFLTRVGFQRIGGNYSMQAKSEIPAGFKAPYDDDDDHADELDGRLT